MNRRPTGEARPLGQLLLWGPLLLLGGLASFYFFGQVTTFDCERVGDGVAVCDVTGSIFGIQVRDRGLWRVNGAYVQEYASSSSDSSNSTYQIVISTTDGATPLTLGGTAGYWRKEAFTEELNTLLSDGDSAFQVRTRREIWINCLGGFFVFLGAATMFDPIWKFLRGEFT